MAESPYCRVCLKSKRNQISLYIHVQQKYLPSVIENICGLLISSIDEPEALICKECALAIIQADEIIQKCQESHRILVEQRNVRHLEQVKAELELGTEEKPAEQYAAEEQDFDMELLPQPSVEELPDKCAELVVEVKLETQDSTDALDEHLYIEPEMLVDTILENPETHNSHNIAEHSNPLPAQIPATPPTATSSLYCSTTKSAKPKKKFVRSREQYLKRKIRNLPVKEPLTLIGGAGVVRKRKPKSFHRAIPNFYFKCELCHEFESNVASYSVTHLNTVHQIERPAIFKCQLCDAKPFIKNQSLQEHITTIHQQQPKPRDFLCTACGKTFIKNCHLQKHLLSVHKRDAKLPYKCEQEECELSFADQYLLKVHMKQAHSGHKSFACELCGKAFAVIYALRTHMKKLHPVEPYICSQCGYKFENKMRYETHVKRSRCKPPSFVCRFCERTYDKLVRLEAHLKAAHHIDPEYY